MIPKSLKLIKSHPEIKSFKMGFKNTLGFGFPNVSWERIPQFWAMKSKSPVIHRAKSCLGTAKRLLRLGI